MKEKETCPDLLSRLIIKVTNPCILSVLLLLGIILVGTPELLAAVIPALLLLLFLVLLPLIYVAARMFFSGSFRQLSIKNPTLFLKAHPADILVLEVLCGVPCYFVMAWQKAPPLLLSTLVGLLVVTFFTAGIYKFYRVSYHLAALTVIVFTGVIAWGPAWLIAISALPLVGWAKYRRREHTIAQILIAVMLATVVTLVGHWAFG